jgi:hypothetical protein
MQLIACDFLLPREFLVDQFLRNAQSCPGFMGDRLGASQPGIGRAHWPGDSEHLSVTFQHHECGLLIGQPTERRKRHEPI